jgi:hypothetical protein
MGFASSNGPKGWASIFHPHGWKFGYPSTATGESPD